MARGRGASGRAAFETLAGVDQILSALGAESGASASVDLLQGVPYLTSSDGFVSDALGVLGGEIGFVERVVGVLAPLLHGHVRLPITNVFCQAGFPC